MKLDFFSENLKSGNVLSGRDLQQIDVFVQSALYCHLDEATNKVCCIFVLAQQVLTVPIMLLGHYK